jgi:hypothetical protein
MAAPMLPVLSMRKTTSIGPQNGSALAGRPFDNQRIGIARAATTITIPDQVVADLIRFIGYDSFILRILSFIGSDTF